jgi:ABC-type protease/lipase transport system fused ATPase/permease subunit
MTPTFTNITVILFMLLTAGSAFVILFHVYRFILFYRLNKQVERILQAKVYQRNQEMADELIKERERKVDELSAYRLEKRGDGYTKFYHVPESDIDII